MTYYTLKEKGITTLFCLNKISIFSQTGTKARSMEGKHVVFVQHQNELRKKGFLYVLSILIENEK